MHQDGYTQQICNVGDGSGLDPTDRFHKEEVLLALRNRGMPLEALRYPVTPTGMHYLLVHYDIPDVNGEQWRLSVGWLASRPLSLSLDDIKGRPAKTLAVSSVRAGTWPGQAGTRRYVQPDVGLAATTARVLAHN